MFYSPSCLARRQRKDLLSSSQLSRVYHTRWRLSSVFLIAERQSEKRKLWIPIFIVFCLTRPKIKPGSTVSVADALSTQPLIGLRVVSRTAEPVEKGKAPAPEPSFFTPMAPASELQFFKVWLRLHITVTCQSH